MGRKDVGSNLGLKEMDPLYFYVLLSDEKNCYCLLFIFLLFWNDSAAWP